MRTNPRRGVQMTLWAGVLALSLGACGAMKSQAEGVFLQQNQVSSALMQAIIAAEADDPALADQLYGREADLQRACGPLQKVGFQNLNGDQIDRMVQVAAFNSLRACEQKSGELAKLLWQVDPITAEGYLSDVQKTVDAPRPLSAFAPKSLMR